LVKVTQIKYNEKNVLTVYTNEAYHSPLFVYIGGASLFKHQPSLYSHTLEIAANAGFCAVTVDTGRLKKLSAKQITEFLLAQIQHLRESCDYFDGSFSQPVCLSCDTFSAPLVLSLVNNYDLPFKVSSLVFFSPVLDASQIDKPSIRNKLLKLPQSLYYRSLPPVFLCHTVDDELTKKQGDELASALDEKDIVVQELRVFNKDCASNFQLSTGKFADYALNSLARFLINIRNDDIIKKYSEI
jgi:hypothetical protein